MDTIKFYFDYIDSQFYGFSPIIRLTAFVVVLLIILYVLSLLRLLFINRVIRKRNKSWKNIKERFEVDLRNIFYSSKTLYIEEIKEQLSLKSDEFKHRNQKNQLTDLFILLKNEETPTNPLNRENYEGALVLFALEKHWIKEISSNKLERIKQALNILTDLVGEVSAGTVAPLLYHRNKNIRKLARSEYIKYESEDVFRFMEEENFDKNFNRLDEIRIHASLKQKSLEHPLPLFNRWIKNTTNDNYKCFLIREVGFFNQIKSAPFLLDIFRETENHKIKAEIANTFGVLKYEEALPELYSQFYSSRLVVQNSIINAIGMIRKKESLDFLKSIYRNDAYNEEMKMNIRRVIKNYDGMDKIDGDAPYIYFPTHTAI